METRKIKMTANKGGSGGVTYRATLPANWIRQMGLSEENRELKLYFDGKQIIIENNEGEIKMLQKLLEMAKVEIEKEMEDMGYIDDSDRHDRFLDELVRDLTKKELVPDEKDLELYYEKEGEIEELSAELLEMARDYIQDNYESKGRISDRGDYDGCYYKDIKGFVNWSACWNDNSIQEAYEEFINLYDVDITIEEYAKAYDVDIEDYID